jgi:hypothetical protein
MATFGAKAGAAAIFAGLMFLASAAHACDERYPSTCKPTAGKAEPVESRTATSKPLQISARRRGAKTAKAASERSAHIGRSRLARKAASRREAAQARRARAEAAVERRKEARRSAAADTVDRAPPELAEDVRKDPPERAQRSLRVADGSNETNSGFASVWKERTVVTAEAAEFVAPRAPSEPASNPVQPPVRVASQNEVNEIDLAAADASGSTDSSWLRGLFLALGGLLAVGSALRFLV